MELAWAMPSPPRRIRNELIGLPRHMAVGVSSWVAGEHCTSTQRLQTVTSKAEGIIALAELFYNT